MRLALGARPSVLLREAILESLMLSTTGGLLGLELAAMTLRVGVSWLPETLPRVNEIGLDWRVLVFAITLALITGIVCGLAPAFAALRSANEALKEVGRTGTSGGGHARLRSALVVGEIAIALALLVASGLLPEQKIGRGLGSAGPCLGFVLAAAKQYARRRLDGFSRTDSPSSAASRREVCGPDLVSSGFGRR
jgi:hypothetical protein